MPREVTEIRLDEYGDETHESWVLIRAGRCQTTQRRLFDSEVNHMHFITVTVTRCSRERSLNHDHLIQRQTLLEVDMSEAQWGAFVSSFGHGVGVPATLTFLGTSGPRGHVAQAPAESRLEESMKEVGSAGEAALAEVQKSHAAVVEAFESGAGKKAMRAALRDLGIRLENAPANMEFAATSLAKAAEDVVTKARGDIEAMVSNAQTALGEGDAQRRLLGGGDEA